MKKLLIVTGAGASLDFGMPSVKEIDLLIENWAKEILPLKENSDTSLYSWVKEQLQNYIQQNQGNRQNVIMSFENLLYTVQSMAALATDIDWRHFNNNLNPFIKIDEFPEIIRFNKNKKADGEDFRFLHSHIVDSLLKHFRNKCKTLDVDKPNELQQLTIFFNSLKEDFKIGFINLNYDNVVLSALPDLKTGFDKQTGEFKRSELYDGEWNFCYHLHGSVHFDMKLDKGRYAEMHKIFWNPNLSSQFSDNSSGRNTNNTNEGLSHLNSCIITGLDKANQILKEPFAQYFMQLDRLIYESDAILFMGYGFNDLHLNSIFRFDNNKTRKIAIIDFAKTDDDGMSFRRDAWSFGVKNTLFTPPLQEQKIKEPNCAGYFKNRKILEKLPLTVPIAIWYDGVLEACKYANTIKAELK